MLWSRRVHDGMSWEGSEMQMDEHHSFTCNLKGHVFDFAMK